MQTHHGLKQEADSLTLPKNTIIWRVSMHFGSTLSCKNKTLYKKKDSRVQPSSQFSLSNNCSGRIFKRWKQKDLLKQCVFPLPSLRNPPSYKRLLSLNESTSFNTFPAYWTIGVASVEKKLSQNRFLVGRCSNTTFDFGDWPISDPIRGKPVNSFPRRKLYFNERIFCISKLF